MPHKRTDPFYLSPEWKRVRILVLKRDNYCCIICGADVSLPGAARVDHIRRVKDGGAPLDPANLRTLCITHDNQAHREKGSSSPRRQERFGGCDGAGIPLDRDHPWNRRE
jgi:5-methylcytosine-specific restriction endonuclease McrA